MKRIFYILMAVLMLSSCETSWLDESKHPMPDGVGATPEFVFDGESTISVNKFGGDYTATIKANQPWLVESTVSWITVTSNRVGKGDGTPETVSFTVAKNPGLEPREGKIRMWITNDDEAFIIIKQDPLLLEDLGTDWFVTVNGNGDGSSWSSPTTLSKALAAAVDADKIYVAAGTYVPEDVLPGGAPGGDETFYVKANVSIVGGYPANPKEGDVADPVNNPVIISGNDACYHCMVIGAPRSDLFSVKISGLTITKGKPHTTATQVPINGGVTYKSYGGGMTISGGRNLIENCNIIGNYSEKSNAGVYLTGGAETTFRNCRISENSGKGNGCGMWNGPNCVTYMYNCEVARNTTSGVGSAIYNYEVTLGNGKPSLYMANCEVAGNSAGSFGAIYCRSSNMVMVNCTIHGNSSKKGAAISVYGDGAILNLVSSTVTANTGSQTPVVYAESKGKLNLYNSVVAGNTDPTNSDAEGYEKAEKSLIGGGTSMFGAYNAGVYPLLSGAGLTGGMTIDELKSINTAIATMPLIPEDVEVDQKGNKRTGSKMGAYVGN